MKVFTEDVWTSRSLVELGEYSELELQHLAMVIGVARCTNPYTPFTLMEAGPYIGDMTIPLSRMVDQMYVFEPQPQVREVLEWNLRENGCENVQVFPFALGHMNGKMRVVEHEMGNSPGSNYLREDIGTTEVEVRTLDGLDLSGGELSRPVISMIKADVEGMEIPLLYGARHTIKRERPLLFLENNAIIPEGQPSLDDVLEHLQYDAYKYEFPMWRADNWRQCEDIFHNTASFMTLGVPRRGEVSIGG